MKNQENMTLSQEKGQLADTNTKITQMLKLAWKDFKELLNEAN